MPHPQHSAPSIALYIHLGANLERAEVPACFKEGEIEDMFVEQPEGLSKSFLNAPCPRNLFCQVGKPHGARLGACNFHTSGQAFSAPPHASAPGLAQQPSQGQQDGSLPQPQAPPQLPPDPVHCLIPLHSCPQHPTPESGDTSLLHSFIHMLCFQRSPLFLEQHSH